MLKLRINSDCIVFYEILVTGPFIKNLATLF